MRKLTMQQKAAAVIAAGAVTIAGIGTAYAAWTSTGSGDGSATSEANQTLSFTGATVVTKLYPTGAGSIDFSVANPNHYNVRLGGIAVSKVYDMADNAKADVRTTCALTFTAPTDYTGANFLVQKDASAQVVHLPGSLAMGNGADNSCANKSFGVVLSATTASE